MWRHDPGSGAPALIGLCVVALPSADSACVAEVDGCRASLALPRGLRTADRRVRAIGDNLGA
eukprot:1304736-Pyramimonas_sp.AAC.1